MENGGVAYFLTKENGILLMKSRFFCVCFFCACVVVDIAIVWGRVFNNNLDQMWEFAKEFLRAPGPPNYMKYGCDEIALQGIVIPKYSLPSSGGLGAAELLLKIVGDLEDHRSVKEVLDASLDDFHDPQYVCSPPPYFS